MERKRRPQVLCVDDDPAMLQLLSLTLERQYDVTTAPDGMTALELLQRRGPFAVVLADMRMPGMEGVTFLGHARQVAPDATRILLTGNADFEVALAAINDGNVFRFLTKPCSPAVLLDSVRAATEHNQTLAAERQESEQSQRGWVKAVVDVVAMSNPAASNRAHRAARLAGELTRRFSLGDSWLVEAAALLSQIGSISLPPEALEKVYQGLELTAQEEDLIKGLPRVVKSVFSDVPHFDAVVGILVYQHKRFGGSGPPRDGVRGKAIPWGARVLKIVLDFLILETQGLEPATSLATMRGRVGWYDPEYLDLFAELRGILVPDILVRELRLRAVQPGMVFAEDVKTRTGLLLIPRGQEVTESLLERIHALPSTMPVVEPVFVMSKGGDAEKPDKGPPARTARTAARKKRQPSLTAG